MHPIPETKRAEVIEALEINPNAAAVARQLGISSSAVCYIAKAAKISLGRSGPKKITAEKYALVVDALSVNPNASAIARELGGMSYQTVSRIARKANIKLGYAAQKAASAAKK